MAVKRIAFDGVEVNIMLDALKVYSEQLEQLENSLLNPDIILDISISRQYVSDLYGKLSRYRRKMESEDRISASRH